MPDPSEPTPITIEQMTRLAIGPGNALFWDGARVEVKRRLDLSFYQKAFALIVSVCAVLGALGGLASGINNASVFLCARHITWLSCPAETL